MQRNRRSIVYTTVLVSILIVLAGIGGGLMIAFSPPPTVDKPPARVEYRIIGTVPRAAVSFLNDDGNTEDREATLPGSYRFRAVSGRALALTVRRLGDTGAVGCVILVDGRTLQSILAENERAEAVCSGVVP